MRVGVVGIGGLGQMGIQLARAMGNTVTAISTSPRKEAAAREIGADSFVVSTSKESMAAAAGSLDLILNTVSATHDVNTYLPLLVSVKCLRQRNFPNLNIIVQAAKGVIVQIGFTLQPHSVSQVPLIMRSLAIAGSIIGGLPATQVQEHFYQTILSDLELGQDSDLTWSFVGLHRFLSQAQDCTQDEFDHIV